MTGMADLVLDAQAELGEGVIWDARRQWLYWVDITGHKLHVFDPGANRDRVIEVGQFIGTVVPRKSGGVMVAVYDGFAGLDLDTGRLEIIADPESDQPDTRFNDGKCDPAGRFWAGTMSLKGVREQGSLYYLDADHTVRRMLTKVSTSNGIVWSQDARTMYFIDTPTMTVAAFDYDVATGNITNRRVAIAIPPGIGRPDGMTIDTEGMLWIAMWDGGAVTRWNPRTAELLQTIPVPAQRATACAFGGPKLDRLYITTARRGLTPEALANQPHAGGLFCVEPGVAGVPAFEYAG
jgi:sugar lactone lactonase YvrE